jgi:hypothetical protein
MGCEVRSANGKISWAGYGSNGNVTHWFLLQGVFLSRREQLVLDGALLLTVQLANNAGTSFSEEGRSSPYCSAPRSLRGAAMDVFSNRREQLVLDTALSSSAICKGCSLVRRGREQLVLFSTALSS